MTSEPVQNTPPPSDVGAQLDRSVTGRHLRLAEFVIPLDIGDSTTDGAARLSIVDGHAELEIYSRELGGYATFTGILTPAAATSDLKDAIVAGGLMEDGGVSPLDLDGGTLTAGTVTTEDIAVTGEFAHSGATFGVFGTTPAAQASSTAELKAMLASFGFIPDGGATALNLDGGSLTAGAAVVSSLTATGNVQADVVYGNNGLQHLAGTLLFFAGTGYAAKPTVSGSRGGNAALASLLTIGATYGLWTDGTTA